MKTLNNKQKIGDGWNYKIPSTHHTYIWSESWARNFSDLKYVINEYDDKIKMIMESKCINTFNAVWEIGDWLIKYIWAKMRKTIWAYMKDLQRTYQWKIGLGLIKSCNFFFVSRLKLRGWPNLFGYNLFINL